ncbi:MAG TPA: serine/threonine protein kinase [Polyangiaceae bacterium]|nr:serine/threonine protein kinase [Polyangiaceae bacterium]
MAAALSSSPLPSTDLTGRQLGRYEVLCQLASGGMATVYVARRGGVAGFERLVAIKVLHPHLAHDEEFISMFLDEARLAARIRNPNVVATLDISDTEGDGYFLVMDYVEGDHLGHLLRGAARGGERLPTAVTARILMDALAGLQAAHELTSGTGEPLRLVHRDLSPHNILVGDDGVARITDFGVAKAQVRLSSTRDGQFKGKLSYMAPEQAASGQADQRSDLFSMGIVLWESLTGRRLFRGENNADVLNKVLNPQVPNPSQLDPALAPFDEVTQRALAVNPDDRYQTAELFLEAVETAALAVDGIGTPRSVGKEVKRWLGQKMSDEKDTIRAAIEALGRNELVPGVLPRPMDSGSQSISRTGPATGQDATLGARPSTLAREVEATEPRRDRRLLLPLVGIFLLFLSGGVGAAIWLFAGAEEPTGPSATDSETASRAMTDGTQDTPTVQDPAAQDPAAQDQQAAQDPAAQDQQAAQDPAAQDPAAQDPAAQDPTAQDTPRDEPAASSRRRGTRRGRHHGRRRQTTSASTGETATPPPEPPPSSGDDDLMLNPYRR